ncbi:hypothetical protein [Ensifer sp. SL37]|uniref:hypothetical protein n=1 Tax=Ensifer sp. SL37 TaxID=2995137 RepID=UPI002274D167|nr:hypothetical protein [Ensifer sp. SL37]MCY1740384.1 hypothetical protein [Ensifer sp. SL37]
MIDFVMLSADPDQTALEFVRAYISYDCRSARYSPEVKSYSPDKIASFERKAIGMKDPDTGESFRVVPLFVSEKIKESDDPMGVLKRHIRAWFSHPLRHVIAKEIERLDA